MSVAVRQQTGHDFDGDAFERRFTRLRGRSRRCIKHWGDSDATFERGSRHFAGIEFEGRGHVCAVGGGHRVGADDVVHFVVGVATEEVREHGLNANKVPVQVEGLLPDDFTRVTRRTVAIGCGGDRHRGRVKTSADLEL